MNSYYNFLVLLFMNLSFLSPQSLNNFVSSEEVYSTFIHDLISSVFPHCKLLVMYGNYDKSKEKHLQNFWLNTFSSVISNEKIISNSAGVINSDFCKTENHNASHGLAALNVTRNPFDVTLSHRPFRTINATEYCHVVILILPVCLPELSKAEFMLHTRLNLPLLNPTTMRNQDKFLILSNASCARSLYNKEVIQKLKYKLFLPVDGKTFKLYQHCSHCLIKEKLITNPELTSLTYFPDFQQNYFGSILKVSATDKLPGLFEIETDPKSGINFPKRGVYALALVHLRKGLNFTWKLYRSSGGGSTGHPLQNGTWVGTVGDIYSKKVDFGLVCGMTYIRHSIIELCATITFEYISFAVGPRARVYTWRAIFWPFKGLLWFGMIMSTVLVTITSYFLLRFTKQLEGQQSWGILSLAQYFPRVFIEQADELPADLSQSVKIIIGYWLLFALIGSTVYRAKMVGFMTFPVLETEPENFDELAKSKYDIQFHYFGNVAYNTFKTSTSPTYMTIFQKMSREPSPLKCLKSTMNTKKPTSCILFGCVYEELKHRNLSDRFGQSPIRISPNYGFMYTPGVLHEKRASFSVNFKWILQNSMQMGLNLQWEKSDMSNLLKARNVWLSKLGSNERNNYTFHYNFEASDVLHLENLKGAFSVLCVGTVLALTVFTVEWFGKPIRRCLYHNKSIPKSNNIGGDLEIPLNQLNN